MRRLLLGGDARATEGGGWGRGVPRDRIGNEIDCVCLKMKGRPGEGWFQNENYVRDGTGRLDRAELMKNGSGRDGLQRKATGIVGVDSWDDTRTWGTGDKH